MISKRTHRTRPRKSSINVSWSEWTEDLEVRWNARECSHKQLDSKSSTYLRTNLKFPSSPGRNHSMKSKRKSDMWMAGNFQFHENRITIFFQFHFNCCQKWFFSEWMSSISDEIPPYTCIQYVCFPCGWEDCKVWISELDWVHSSLSNSRMCTHMPMLDDNEHYSASMIWMIWHFL